MPASSERPSAIGVDELRSLEISVLKALCLTINTAGSELKYKILDSLSDEDFYFSILRAVFRTLSEMHQRGDYVIFSNLEEELQKAGAEFPPGFGVEQLFDGTLPSLEDLNAWVGRLKERSRSGLVPTVEPPSKEPPKPTAARNDATVVKSVAEVKRKIAEEMRKSNPPAAAAPSHAKSSPRIPVEPHLSTTPRPKPPPTPVPPEKPAPPHVTPKPKARPPALSSEGDEWSTYLDGLATGEGRSFDLGFLRLDRELGGLAPGLMLLVDEDRPRVVNFLKQVTDQIASASSTYCLFLTTEFPKAALRLHTLARLAMVPLQDIEKGRLRRGSPDWQKVDRAGRGAGEWLRRVFVYELEGAANVPLLRELARKLQESAGTSPCLVVLDSLEKLERSGSTLQEVASELKELADRQEMLILASTADPALLASKHADYAAVFREASQGGVELEILRSGRDRSTVALFRYEPGLCRFSEADLSP